MFVNIATNEKVPNAKIERHLLVGENAAEAL
jgi:hypothetical protein